MFVLSISKLAFFTLLSTFSITWPRLRYLLQNSLIVLVSNEDAREMLFLKAAQPPPPASAGRQSGGPDLSGMEVVSQYEKRIFVQLKVLSPPPAEDRNDEW